MLTNEDEVVALLHGTLTTTLRTQPLTKTAAKVTLLVSALIGLTGVVQVPRIVVI